MSTAVAHFRIWKRPAVRLGLGAIAAMVLGVLGWAIWTARFSPHGSHTHLIARVESHTSAVKFAIPGYTYQPAGFQFPPEDRTRVEALRAIGCALGNALWDYRRCDDVRLRAIADRLDRTQAQELKTGIGCLRLVDELIELCPTARDYVWFEDLRAMQARGIVATLPSKR